MLKQMVADCHLRGRRTRGQSKTNVPLEKGTRWKGSEKKIEKGESGVVCGLANRHVDGM